MIGGQIGRDLFDDGFDKEGLDSEKNKTGLPDCLDIVVGETDSFGENLPEAFEGGG
jgi:hypothetical protein